MVPGFVAAVVLAVALEIEVFAVVGVLSVVVVVDVDVVGAEPADVDIIAGAARLAES